MRRVAHTIVVLGFCALASTALAGIQVGSGSTTLFGRTSSWAAWDVFADPGTGIVNPTNGQPTGLEFHDGRLYIVGAWEAIDRVAAVAYTPGAAANLSAPTRILFPQYPAGDARRFVRSASITVNTSGAGLGAFPPGDPTLTGLTVSQASARGVATTQTAGATADMTIRTTTALTDLPYSLEFVPSLNQFVTVGGETQVATTSFRFYSHTSAGLSTMVSQFTVTDPNANQFYSAQSISAAFATALLGMPIANDCLLAVGFNNIGALTPPILAVFSLTGSRLGSTSLSGLPGYNGVPGGGEGPAPRALAVDEFTGHIYIGDRFQGRIYTLGVPTVPTPGAPALLTLALGAAATRRRRATALNRAELPRDDPLQYSVAMVRLVFPTRRRL